MPPIKKYKLKNLTIDEISVCHEPAQEGASIDILKSKNSVVSALSAELQELLEFTGYDAYDPKKHNNTNGMNETIKNLNHLINESKSRNPSDVTSRSKWKSALDKATKILSIVSVKKSTNEETEMQDKSYEVIAKVDSRDQRGDWRTGQHKISGENAPDFKKYDATPAQEKTAYDYGYKFFMANPTIDEHDFMQDKSYRAWLVKTPMMVYAAKYPKTFASLDMDGYSENIFDMKWQEGLEDAETDYEKKKKVKKATVSGITAKFSEEVIAKAGDTALRNLSEKLEARLDEIGFEPKYNPKTDNTPRELKLIIGALTTRIQQNEDENISLFRGARDTATSILKYVSSPEYALTLAEIVKKSNEEETEMRLSEQEIIEEAMNRIAKAKSPPMVEDDMEDDESAEDPSEEGMDPDEDEEKKKMAEMKLVKKALTLSDDQRAHAAELQDQDLEKFLALSDTARAREASPVYKSASGEIFTKAHDPWKVKMAKELDETRQESRIEKSRHAELSVNLRAETELKYLPGSVATRAAILKSIESESNEELRGEMLSSIKAANDVVAKSFSFAGREGGGLEPGSPQDQIEKIAKKYADEHKITIQKAKVVVSDFPEVKQLYNQIPTRSV